MPISMLKDPRTGLLRIPPAGPVNAFSTHAIRAPMRPARCNDPYVDCPLWETGWTTTIDPNLDQGPDRIIYIRVKSGRRFSERIREDGVYEFYFYPHQICFTPHKAPAGDEQFYWRAGDWRGNPTGERIKFQRPDDWVDHSWNSIDKWATALQRG